MSSASIDMAGVRTPGGYQALAEALRADIQSGAFPPGAILPTERELQRRFSVSRTTVRRALAALVESGWAELLPNRGVIARSGPSDLRTTNVAFIDDSETLNHRLFFDLSCRLHVVGLTLVHIDSKTHGLVGSLELAAEQGFAGAFVWSKDGFPDAARIRALAARVPIVALDHALRGVDLDLVVADNLGGGRAAVDHLVRLGRKRIAVTGMMDMLEINHERFSGWMQGLFANGLQPQVRDILWTCTSGMTVQDTEALEARLRSEDRPDGLVVFGDIFVPEICEAVFRCGLRIPEDVAVIAFGGGPPVKIDDFSLTTVEFGTERLAETAVRQLESRIADRHRPTECVVLPISVRVGGSCGEPYEDWSPVSGAEAHPVPGRWLGFYSLHVRTPDRLKRAVSVRRSSPQH
ncbi:MAG: GntR family transcriptional regulator [Fimbriimonadaceae bacterium]